MKPLQLFILMAASLMISAKPTQAQQRPRSIVSVKFEPFPQHGGPIINVRLAHAITARFIVDTGAATACLAPDLVQKLGLPIDTESYKGRKVVTLNHLEIGSWDISDGKFQVLEGPVVTALKESKIDGILGTSLLGQCAMFLNVEKQECTLYYPGNLAKEQVESMGFTGQEAISNPLMLDHPGGLYHVSVQVGGKTVSLCPDTGGLRTILPKSLLQGFLGARIWERERLTIDGVNKEPVYLVPNVDVGAAKGDKQTVMFTGDGPGRLTRALGMDFLAQFNTLMDFPAQRLYLHKLEGTNLSLDSNRQDNAEDMIVGRDKDIWKVVSITQDNRFYRAGVRQDDTIEAVNQTEVTGLVGDQVLAELYRTSTPSLHITRFVDGRKQSRIFLVARK